MFSFSVAAAPLFMFDEANVQALKGGVNTAKTCFEHPPVTEKSGLARLLFFTRQNRGAGW